VGHQEFFFQAFSLTMAISIVLSGVVGAYVNPRTMCYVAETPGKRESSIQGINGKNYSAVSTGGIPAWRASTKNSWRKLPVAG
jgi:multidrug efflux pump subunit AcrB